MAQQTDGERPPASRASEVGGPRDDDTGSTAALAGAGVPPAEVHVDEALVRRLVAAQHPDLATLPIRDAGSGWDNVMFRLGDALAVRLPRRSMAARLLEHEQRWLPVLAGRLPLPVPAPVRLGVPGEGYRWPWSVSPWLPGRVAELEPLDPPQWRRWAGFLTALHGPAPAGAPVNPHRGVPLAQRAAALAPRLAHVERSTSAVTPTVRRAWHEGLAAEIDVAPTWIHGDLHARNVLVERGAMTGVIDWGDVAAGDRATDLASLWLVLPEARMRAATMDALESVTAATWARARAWAVLLGVVMIDAGMTDDPGLARMGARALRAVDEGP